MTRPRLFVELCAGLAAVSLRLQGGPRCRPPVSRMGNKAGYAQAILGALGLHAGQGADAYLWCEPDDGCRALLQAYGRPEVLAEAAEVIRGWKDEPPRELWERLRAEGPVKWAGGREVARWVTLCAWTIGGKDGLYPGAGYAITVAEGAEIRSSNGRVDWRRPQTPSKISDRLASLPALPPTVVGDDARVVDPREVARWAWIQRRRLRGSEGFRPPWQATTATAHGGTSYRPDAPADEFLALPALPPTVVGADAREVEPPRLDGVYVYIDPPYVNTTGYGADLPRAEVVALARRWHEAGATVAISEQEPVEGWADRLWPIDITATRRGQKRTFSRQQSEWLTLNRPPVEKPAEQIPLFALGAV